MDEYMFMREEAATWFKNKFMRIFEEAFGHIQSDILFMFDHEYATTTDNGKITIYTNRPGILIGVAGKNVDKLKEALKREFKHDYNVYFHEVNHYCITNQFTIDRVE